MVENSRDTSDTVMNAHIPVTQVQQLPTLTPPPPPPGAVMTTVSPSGCLNPARVPFPHVALLSVSFQLIASKQDPWSASSSSPSVLPSALLVFG